MTDDSPAEERSTEARMQKNDVAFLDLYDFLGIPPSSPSNLIYLAVQKIETGDWGALSPSSTGLATRRESFLALVRERLLTTINKRLTYEQEWESYYYPIENRQTDIEEFCDRSSKTPLFTCGLREKSPLLLEYPPAAVAFEYKNDFIYFMMRDLPKEGDVFFLGTETPVALPPLEDKIYFENKQFYLKTFAEAKIKIVHDAMGKTILLDKKNAVVPLHIGDRIEFNNGTRLILRTIYAGKLPEEKALLVKPEIYYLNFQRENVSLSLEPTKIYIVGRSTTDIRNMPFDEERFCFVNIGRRERSISRQNCQIFYNQGKWYIQDLGSRYGTTLDFKSHPKLETLVGGGIMALEEGSIRLGYDKSYTIDVTRTPKPKESPKEIVLSSSQEGEASIYDLPLFL